MTAASFNNCVAESIKTTYTYDLRNFYFLFEANFLRNEILCSAASSLFNGEIMSDKHSDAKQVPVDAPERRRLPILLRRAWYGLNQAFRRRIAHTGVTPDQFTVLRTLIENEVTGLTQSELTRMMASDPNTIAALVERLEKNGLLRRDIHESDRRAYRLRLKPAGKWKYDEVREAAVDLQMEILSALPEERREQFLEDLALIGNVSISAAEKVMKKRGKG
jgi:DNA-binding MarR family transcriptional regulator